VVYICVLFVFYAYLKQISVFSSRAVGSWQSGANRPCRVELSFLAVSLKLTSLSNSTQSYFPDHPYTLHVRGDHCVGDCLHLFYLAGEITA